jgi:dihydroorotate dehydrogenase (fumarate)
MSSEQKYEITSVETFIQNIKLDSCLMNASGCHCTTKEELDDLQHSHVGAIVSKSSTLNPRDGNNPPRLFLNNYGSINSMGIPNHGYQFYLQYGLTSNKPFIQSIYPFDLQELEIMLTQINQTVTHLSIIEINISCPNVSNIINFEKYLEKINDLPTDKLILGLKMAPFYDLSSIKETAYLLKKYKHKIEFITCCNSLINGLIINPDQETTVIHPNTGLGGIGGIYIKPISLANVYNFHKYLQNDITIIGCGGIENGNDIFEYILCGASAVQVGTWLVRKGTKSFQTLETEFKEVMKQHHYSSLNDFKGHLRIRESN